MPYRHLDEDRSVSYSGISPFRLSRPHLRRGPRGALVTNPTAKRRFARLFLRFEWERSEVLRSLWRTFRLPDQLYRLRRDRDDRLERARPAAWAYYRQSRAWRIHAGFNAVVAPALKPKPVLDPNRRVSVTLDLPAHLVETLETLAALCTEADSASDGFTSHGPLTVEGLLAMLAEDAGMVITRSGSWEGANMGRVLACHGYQV